MNRNKKYIINTNDYIDKIYYECCHMLKSDEKNVIIIKDIVIKLAIMGKLVRSFYIILQGDEDKMGSINGSVILYGINDIHESLDEIIKSLNIEKQCFEIKLIISEAVTNAYVHGNNRDESKPISIKWELKNNLIRIIVKDCGQGLGNLNLNKEINEDNILEECGRGLYIINSYSDQVEIKEDSIIMEKYINI